MTRSPSYTYRGRFAPSPSGDLHFGSLVAAVGSFLQAQKHQGEWLLRIEDIDPPREVTGATERILETLTQFQLTSAKPALFQSQQASLYDAVLIALQQAGYSYHCLCTRKAIMQNSQDGTYPQTCRQKHIVPGADKPTSIRFAHHTPVFQFDDQLQGNIQLPRRFATDDAVIKRKDGLYAYQLAVVVDDIFQDITEVVRGADLVETTSVQIQLYHAISNSVSYLKRQPQNIKLTEFIQRLERRKQENREVPQFLHLPVAVTEPQKKLSKQNHAKSIYNADTNSLMSQALYFLGIQLPKTLCHASAETQLAWCIEHSHQWSFDPVREKQIDEAVIYT